MMTDSPGTNAADYPEVLLVSADLGLTQFLSEGLLPEGFWTSAVRSGLQALEVFRLRTFDIVLVDAALSDLPVDALIGRLRESHDASGREVRQSGSVPIVLIAGMAQELEPYDLGAIGPAGVFVAPFELSDLVARLRDLTSASSQDR